MESKAFGLLDDVKGLDDLSITKACQLAGFDSAFRGLARWELCLTASFCQKDAKDTQTRDRESQARVARFEGKRAKR